MPPAARAHPARRPRAVAVAAALAVLVGLGAACGSDDGPVVAWPPPAGAGAPPGRLLGARPIDGPTDVPGARAWDVAYALTDVDGQPAAATGLLVVPPGAAPAGGWPLVVWAHPTRGSADRCAPSRDGPGAIPDLPLLLAEGWAVAAPDYEGLGAPGPHPYLVGASGAESLLRAAQAAPEVEGAGVEAAGPVALLGFSQGGHAAAFAAEQAPRRAPELDLRGVAVAAPVADVAAFVARAEGLADQVGVAVTVVGAYAATYDDVDPAAVLAPPVVADLPALEEGCIGEVVERFTGPPSDLLVGPADDDPALAARLAQNRTGDAPVAVPALVVQGTADDLVTPDVTAGLVERWCDRGVAVAHVLRPGAGHGVPLADVAVPWLRERFAGVPAPAGCTTREVPVPG